MLTYVHRVRVWIFFVLLVVLLGGVVSFFVRAPTPTPPPAQEIIQAPTQPVRAVIGKSVEGRVIEAYTFGVFEKPTTKRHIVFVGGVHGGYEWNSVVLAYRAIEYFTKMKNRIPRGVVVTVIPSLNPDGVFAVVGKEGIFSESDFDTKQDTSIGRFNARGVDLNRNFDCKWSPEAQWRGKKVSAGPGAFSEPEAQALRSFVEKLQRQAPDVTPEFIFWHSKANAVYASECEQGILPETRTLMNTYAKAAGYKTVETFDAYPVTGDAEGWLASLNIPAITVELATHDSIEWEKNKKGIDALLFQ